MVSKRTALARWRWECSVAGRGEMEGKVGWWGWVGGRVTCLQQKPHVELLQMRHAREQLWLISILFIYPRHFIFPPSHFYSLYPHSLFFLAISVLFSLPLFFLSFYFSFHMPPFLYHSTLPFFNSPSHNMCSHLSLSVLHFLHPGPPPPNYRLVSFSHFL